MDIGSRLRAGGVDELASRIEKFVRVTDLPEEDASDGDGNSDASEGYDDLEPYGPEPVKKSLEKSATFPVPGETLPSSDEEDAATETVLQQLFSEESPSSISLPLVSAMKGSREKQGAGPRNLSVSWAPDVYDPIPNSLSHAVGSKQKKSRKDREKDNSNNNYKKNGKKGQKGKTPRGGAAGKDKKQLRKHGGRSDKFKTLDASDDDMDIGSPDYCGGSFLKGSATKFHYSVAEAL